MDVPAPAGSTTRNFRLPRLAYLVVVFLLFCVAPLAFSRGGGENGGPAGLSARTALVLIPILAAVFIARTATFVGPAGLRVRAVFGSRRVAWSDVRGLSVSGRSVYAVLADGSVRLPCVRVADLAEVARVSDGRLPEIADPVPKYAPSKRSRR